MAWHMATMEPVLTILAGPVDGSIDVSGLSIRVRFARENAGRMPMAWSIATMEPVLTILAGRWTASSTCPACPYVSGSPAGTRRRVVDGVVHGDHGAVADALGGPSGRLHRRVRSVHTGVRVACENAGRMPMAWSVATIEPLLAILVGGGRLHRHVRPVHTCPVRPQGTRGGVGDGVVHGVHGAKVSHHASVNRQRYSVVCPIILLPATTSGTITLPTSGGISS